MLMKLLWYEFHHFVDLLGMVFNMKDCIDTNLLAMSFFFFFGNNNRNPARFSGD